MIHTHRERSLRGCHGQAKALRSLPVGGWTQAHGQAPRTALAHGTRARLKPGHIVRSFCAIAALLFVTAAQASPLSSLARLHLPDQRR